MFKLSMLFVCLAGALAAEGAKQYRNQAEYQLYDSAARAVAANDFQKALALLNTWARDYADSDYRADRQFLYVLALAGAKQPAKAIDIARDLLTTPDLESVLPSPANRVRLLFAAAAAIQGVSVPTAEELAVSDQASRRLLAFTEKPQGLTDEAWTEARGQMQATAKTTLLFIALIPGTRAMEKGDCATAAAAFSKALEEHPDSVQAAWDLGSADLCLYKTQPSQAVPAIYAFARAAAIDPVKGMADPKWQQDTVRPFLEKVFQQYHGTDPEALEQLKRLAAKSPFPPEGFGIKSLADIAIEKQEAFEKGHPQLALWMKIKAALSDGDGSRYFTSELQGVSVPRLRGILVEAKPACHPTELLVAVPLPSSLPRPEPEITLKLDAPLAGRPELEAEFQWEGVPAAFSAWPFLLTMETERSKIEGLKITPCAPPARKRSESRQ
jgi:thioredoxin-like negative regulator of GroEL